MKSSDIAVIDNEDTIIGYEDKMLVHQQGILHRAFSIFIFNDKKELLLQKRADSKYHSAGLWSNTCCSHQVENEDIEKAPYNRLMFEMGIRCHLNFINKFKYKAQFTNGLVENEIDYIFCGKSNDDPIINIDEVSGYKWGDIDVVKRNIKKDPEKYTIWLKEILCSNIDFKL